MSIYDWRLIPRHIHNNALENAIAVELALLVVPSQRHRKGYAASPSGLVLTIVSLSTETGRPENRSHDSEHLSERTSQ